MSPGDKAERMAHLRSAIAGLEAHPGPARAGAPPRLSVAPALDPALGGGLSGDALHEIAPAQAGDGAAAIGFALALAARFVAASPRSSAALLISEDFCARETGALYGPGLAAHGLSLDRLILVRAPDARALLWAMEEALKSGALAAVVGEMWSLRSITASPPRAGCCLPRGPAARRPCSFMAARSGAPTPSPAPPKRALRSPRLRAGRLRRRAAGSACRAFPPSRRGC